MDRDLAARAAAHAALGDPVRLAIVDELVCSDRTPGELCEIVGVSSSLLAHHLDTLESAGLVRRTPSEADGRKRFVVLVASALPSVPEAELRAPVLFVCSQNSARSQLAAALWTKRTGRRALSAGTEPAARVHPLAVTAARRAGLDLADARPRRIPRRHGRLVVTVCDRAHDDLGHDVERLHWSIPDPVTDGSAAAFERALRAIDDRIHTIRRKEPRQ